MHLNYSVIIPHYASPELLKRALASIPDRPDIQILVIDNTPYKINFSKLEMPVESNLKILYSDPEKGAGHARNVGLKEAKGKWLLFLDADDFYNSGAFEKFDNYIFSEFDIIYFSCTSVFSDTFEQAERHRIYARFISDFLDKKKSAEDNLRYWFVTPCSKLIRKKLIEDNSILFDEVPASNDLMFSVKSGHFAKKIWADNFPVYCITVSEGSLTRTDSKKNSRSRFNASIRQYKFMSAVGRPDMRFKLMSTVIKSLRFGVKEFFWYIQIVLKERVNIF